MNNHAADAEVRNNPSLLGREAYEASLRACPDYGNGKPRPTWEQLDDAARWSWSKATQRP